MTNYIRMDWYIRTAKNADYRGAQYARGATSYTPDEYIHQLRVDAPTAGQLVNLGFFTTINKLVVHNTDPSVALFVKARTAAFSEALTVTFANGGASPDTITDDNTGSPFSLWPAGCYARVSDAEDSGNNDSFLVQSVAANVLTLANSEVLSVRGADAVTIVCDTDVVVKVDADSVACLDNVVPASNVTVIGNGASVSCELSVWGT